MPGIRDLGVFTLQAAPDESKKETPFTLVIPSFKSLIQTLNVHME
jgi:hypothetical protein